MLTSRASGGLSQGGPSTESVQQGLQLLRQRHLQGREEGTLGGRGGGGHADGGRGGFATHLVRCRLLQPPVVRAETAQAQLGEGSGLGQRREGLAQLGEREGEGWLRAWCRAGCGWRARARGG